MQKYLITTLFALLGNTLWTTTSQATWYESSGQAVVNNGDKQLARQQATQEAIKHALLFAGASISSVQHLTNGLLQNDQLEIRSAGEVDSIELIDEVYEGDILTVRVRADIFPQTINCRAADYTKSIVTGWYPIKHRQQAALGQVFELGQQVPHYLQRAFNQQSRSAQINSIEPYYIQPVNRAQQAMELARKTNSQYVLIGEIDSIAAYEQASNSLAFWQSPGIQRDFSLSIHLYDGNSGDKVFSQQHALNATWDFAKNATVDVHSSRFWQSQFGSELNGLLQEMSAELNDTISCLPLYGRVIKVSNETITINLGTQNGLKPGDKLALFQMNQFFDPNGNMHQQYVLHPEPVIVSQVFAESASLISESGAVLANIQANDFVARR